MIKKETYFENAMKREHNKFIVVQKLMNGFW